MLELNGLHFPVNYAPEFIWVSDIQYYDGSLLSEYRTHNLDSYVFHWCDCTEELNRWLVIRASKRSVYELKSGLIGIKEFLLDRSLDSNAYILDIAIDDEIRNVTYVRLENIPEDYLPEDNVLIIPSLMPTIEKTTYPVIIDNHWETDELSEFPRKFMDAYVLIEKSLEEDDDLNPITTAQWQEGLSSRTFYHDMKKANHILNINAIQYASPGYIQFSADRNIGLLVKKNVDNYMQNKEEIEATFHRLSTYLKDNRLNKQDVTPDDLQNEWLREHGEQLMVHFSHPTWLWISNHTENVFKAVKVSMSYYRRIKKLSEYIEKGKAVFAII